MWENMVRGMEDKYCWMQQSIFKVEFDRVFPGTITAPVKRG